MRIFFSKSSPSWFLCWKKVLKQTSYARYSCRICYGFNHPFVWQLYGEWSSHLWWRNPYVEYISPHYFWLMTMPYCRKTDEWMPQKWWTFGKNGTVCPLLQTWRHFGVSMLHFQVGGSVPFAKLLGKHVTIGKIQTWNPPESWFHGNPLIGEITSTGMVKRGEQHARELFRPTHVHF